jgi:octanoyl-[GcvH]:protein N-octanoyltransferase
MIPHSLFPTPFLVFDSTAAMAHEEDILFPFAFDEIVGRKVGEGRLVPLVHLWSHPKAFVLGLRDRKLPQAKQAMDWLQHQGYDVTVRNSGGAAVPLDLGVVNISVIMPNTEQSLNYRGDFQWMFALIAQTLRNQQSMVEKGEVQGSYCPGDFDVSIAGRKFCGIAQRRQIRANAVQAFVNVEGDSNARSSLVKEFYDKATRTGNLDHKQHVPLIEPGRVGSLSEFIPSFTAVQFVRSFLSVLRTINEYTYFQDYRLVVTRDEIDQMVEQLGKRYVRRDE